MAAFTIMELGISLDQRDGLRSYQVPQPFRDLVCLIGLSAASSEEEQTWILGMSDTHFCRGNLGIILRSIMWAGRTAIT